jgi:hypothetical protein
MPPNEAAAVPASTLASIYGSHQPLCGPQLIGVIRKLTGEMTMDSAGKVATVAASNGGILSRERIIARPGFNRWLVPPAALAVHLCIGMAYGFSFSGYPCHRRLELRPA